MALFKDRTGREWSIAIDYIAVEQVKAATGFNILELVNPQNTSALDGLKMLDVFWALCEKQAKDRGLDRPGFIGSLNGDSAEAAGEALEVELINFSPSRLRPTLAKLQAKGRDLRTAAIQRADQLIETIDLTKLLATGSSDAAMSTPASLASTPAASPSES